MADEQVTQREENPEPDFDQAEEDYLSWKKNAPLLYDTLVSHLLEWPSYTCQFFGRPDESKSKGSAKHHFALGTVTGDQSQNHLLVMSATMPSAEATAHPKPHDGNAKQSFKCIAVERRIPHPGDVNKLRICPSNQRIVATKSENGKVYLWDVESAANRPLLTLADNSAPGFALDWNVVGGAKLVSGDNKGTICLYTFDGSFEVRAEATDAADAPQAQTASPTKAATAKYENNGVSVNDCRFQRTHGSIFGAVSDDCTITLWDIRTKTNPFFRILGHTSEIFSLDFAHNDEFLLLTGGSDNLVKLWDIRKVLRPVHEFAGHTDKVLRVEWNPHNETIFASCGEDRSVNLWDCAAIGNDVANEDNMDGPPELFFSHKGHKGVVEDVSWSPESDFELLTVDSENLVQIWEIDDKIYYEE